MSAAALIYPHQLYADQPALRDVQTAVLVEDPLFFRQYPFHRQKLILHRASIQRYAAKLRERGLKVQVIEAHQLLHSSEIIEHLRRWKLTKLQCVDLCDDWLTRRLTKACHNNKIPLVILDDPHYLTPQDLITAYTQRKSKFFFTDFYIQQRKRLGIMIEDDGPIGGKWSFDPENRKKLPPSVRVPAVSFPHEDQAIEAARAYVRQHFPDAIGFDSPFRYPTSHEQAQTWLDEFIARRLQQFGDYEDAMHTEHEILFHSVLTPMLNIGLLTPRQVVEAALGQADAIQLNSLEGFIRQVIGWREFIRLIYLTQGRRQRTRNYWGYTHPMPQCFYDGTSGITPVDHIIQQLHRTGYCHHIERLMILGNFFLLCEIHPDAVYQWFMEFFIDSYDWVMVPNVYGMSQHADGGLMTTKPYISGSSYVLKMSNYRKGPWCEIWDALYWRFIDNHADFFENNPRMAMMAKMARKLGPKLDALKRTAETFLRKLHAR